MSTTSSRLSRRRFLAASAALLAGPAAASPEAPRESNVPGRKSHPGRIDHVIFADRASASKHQARGGSAIDWDWHFGDRNRKLRGRILSRGGSLVFDLRHDGKPGPLTLELREFRTIPDSGLAYPVEVNGVPVAFRNRGYGGLGPTSAFIDLPAPVEETTRLRIKITNLAPDPVGFTEAFLYRDIEAWAHQEELIGPLYVGPTTPPDRDRLARIRSLLPDTPEVRPMFVLPTFAVAQWPPEVTAQRLEEVLKLAHELKMPVELQLNTWWAGTPSGCDGVGGRWYDPAYQQVTYTPSTRSFGLSVPNHWSSVPWLTTRNERFNDFKAQALATFGAILRRHADATRQPAPVLSLVIDNEVTYWGAGNPDTPPDLEADFNPAVVAAARAEGIRLDPRDGLGEEELQFLRRSLRDYNRRMAAGLLHGLGSGALADRVYTHTFLRGWCFRTPIQATEVGVLRDVRLGVEWDNMRAADLALLDQQRELGIPAGINDERSGRGDAAPDVQFAYASGCDHLSLFNISDDGLKEIADSVAAGWQSFPPQPWRPTLFHLDFQDGESWKRYFTDAEEVAAGVIWPGPARALYGKAPGQINRARLCLRSQDLTGHPRFTRLSLAYRARAFVNGQKSEDAYLAIRAGTSADALQEVDRMTNANEQRQVDLTALAAGSPQIYLEFDFHPIGLKDWVCLYDLALEIPWEEERLLAANRSYRADRLRCESSIAGWRADAFWTLQRVEEELPASALHEETSTLAAARRQYDAGSYRRACEAARAILHRRSALPIVSWQPPDPNRTETGEVRDAGPGFVSLDPYAQGYMGRRLAVAPDARMEMEENGVRRTLASTADLKLGDDLEAGLRGGQVAALLARRGSAAGVVTVFTPATAFALPQLGVDSHPPRQISSVASVHGRGTPDRARSCWLEVGARPFEPGDRVTVRWNPRTGRIVEAILLTPASA